MLSVYSVVKFLDALNGKNRGRPPVWLMRQAGRYLPEYRKLREKWTLRELFLTPELAADVTMLPVDLLGVDAAILFSDITVTALALGLSLDFQDGPKIEMAPFSIQTEKLQPIIEAIKLVKARSPVPLIGFCGAPFTVATYILGNAAKAKQPGAIDLEAITSVTIDYLRMQVEAGVDAIQIFDSWADSLTYEHWREFSYPYLKRLIEAVPVPVILFMRGACFRVDDLVSLSPSAISFDWQVPLHQLRKRVPSSIAVQGNLDPDLLYASPETIQKTVLQLLQDMRGDPSFIVNLGHGVKPDVPVAAVKTLIETVKSFV